MNDLNFICENYKVCWYREMCLPDNQRCPHVVSHDHYPACDWECDKVEVHCKEIVLKKGDNFMKIIQVEYRELVSTGFNNSCIGAIATIEEGETPENVLIRLKNWVKKQLNEKVSKDLSYYEKVQIAKEVMDDVANKQVPF